MEKMAHTMDQAIKAMAAKEGKYLTFSLLGEEYGIGILKVKEIIGMMPITTVPLIPAFVKGVINLRGKVIPVVDLRLKFGMEEIDYTERTCTIVVEIASQAGSVLLGMAKINGGVKILLDIDKVLGSEEMGLSDRAA
jgi:purine-binding chemotaxis protein CheW